MSLRSPHCRLGNGAVAPRSGMLPGARLRAGVAVAAVGVVLGACRAKGPHAGSRILGVSRIRR